MDSFNVISIVLTFAILVGYVNCRFIKMPTTIAIMVSSLLVSFILLVIGEFGHATIEMKVAQILSSLDFHELLMNGMLSFLLFAGSLTVDLTDLMNKRWEIGILASIGTIASAVLIGFLTYYMLHWAGVEIGLIYCMLFGALISPTDPIAVLAIFRELDAPRNLSIFLEGESLFNDGVGIVIFLTIYQLAFMGGHFSIHSVLVLFLRQAFGGIGYGLLIGFIAFKLIKPIDNHKWEILITIMVATGGYAIAEVLDISGPLAMVVAGIFIGNYGRKNHMSARSRENMDNFWEVIDELLNALLFLLIGFELLIVHMTGSKVFVSLLAIPLVLAVRFICVALPMSFFKKRKQYYPHMVKLMTWGGLRGGLAVALALSLPNGSQRELILSMTYFVVVFAILVQGMTVKPLIKASLHGKMTKK